MAVRIGHAVGDENGGARGGAAGDQTTREIRTQTWYNREGGWGVYLECLDAGLADSAALHMERICADDSFGYDQDERKTGYQAIVDAGSINGAEDSEFDCSSLVCACYILAGLNISITSTHSLEKVFMATGKFKAYRDTEHLTNGEYATRGGIYLTAGKHVVMVLDNGKYSGTTTYDPDIVASEQVSEDDVDTPYVLLLGSVRVRSGPGTSYDKLFTGKKGQKLTYCETDPDTGWYGVETDYGIGFVSGKKAYTKLVT